MRPGLSNFYEKPIVPQCNIGLAFLRTLTGDSPLGRQPEVLGLNMVL